MPISKTKIKGNEFRYSDSLHYEWYVKFKDGHIVSMFSDNGDEIQLYTAYEYKNTSTLIEVGIRPFSQNTADIINENQSHNYMVISSEYPSVPIVVDENLKGYPYMMRRKMNINFNLEWVHIIGTSLDSEVYTMIRDTTSEHKNVSNKLAAW